VKGWRHFFDRGLRPCGTLLASIVRLGGREPELRKKANHMSSEEDWGKIGPIVETVREIRPLSKEPRTGFEPLDSGRAPALHAERNVS
jgi:hypothetical protein